MMSTRTLSLLLSLFLLACQGNADPQQSQESTQEQPAKAVEPAAAGDCPCFRGIGSSEKSKPILTVDFSNGKSLSICGYQHINSAEEEAVISEFNIFDCATGDSYVEYDAMENCWIKVREEGIDIQLLMFLPVGEKWEKQLVQIAEQQISPEGNAVLVSKIRAKYLPTDLPESQQAEFLASLERGQGLPEDWEEVLGKLTVLSLNGNEKAWQILKTYDEFTGVEPDGAYADIWKEATATVRWVGKVE